jgi:precorrin-8X/cobalt-precorrin-8 methylmutase
VSHLRDPAAIYAESFATIRREADLSALPEALHEAAIRMIHACGMVEIVPDIVGTPEVGPAVRSALAQKAAVFCDCRMVAAGLLARHLPAPPSVTLDDPAVPAMAKAAAITRSAAAVTLWRERLEGAVVVIGNAPTALFRLLEGLAEGWPKPAAIIATPVGFVGAAESKALLAKGRHGVPFLTLAGRRGGSAIAAAGFNALAGGLS